MLQGGALRRVFALSYRGGMSIILRGIGARVVVLFGFLCVVAPMPARADVSGEAYRDIKKVIEDLLTSEVAHTVVPQVACRAGRVEITKLAAGECTEDDDGHIVTEPTAPDEVCVKSGGKYIKFKLKALQYFPATLQALYSRRFASLKTTVSNEAIELATDRVYKAIMKQLGDTKRQAAQQVGEELADILVKGGDSPVFNEIDADAERDSCVANVQTKLDAGIGASASELDSQCAPATDKNALPCEVALALRAALHGDTNGEDVHVTNLISLAIASALQLDGDNHVREIADEITVMVRTAEHSGEAPDFSKLAASVGALLTDYDPDAAKYAVALAAKVKTITDRISLMRRPIERIIVRVKSVSALGTSHLSLRTVLTDVVDTLNDAQSICASLSTGNCGFVKELHDQIGKDSVLWPIVTSASGGDLQQVAHLAILALFERIDAFSDCDAVDPKQTCKLDAYRRFADSLVQFVLDARDGDASDAVRSAFRSAAEDVVRYSSPYGGFDRQGRADDHLFLFTPELGVRLLWSAGYVNDSSRDLRYIASMQMLRIRWRAWYTSHSYAEFQLSWADPLAPLAEVAVRPNKDFATGARVSYDHSDRLVWNVFAPRADFTVGLPFLSKHLAVSAGISLRMAAPTDLKMLPDGSFQYTYRGLGADGDNWFKFVEFGLAAKYLL